MLAHPYLASACARFPMVMVDPVHQIQTMATDGFYIYINPDFSKKLNEEHLKGVLAHELLHNLLGHNQRQGGRRRDIWHQAVDHATNLLLTELGFRLPKPNLCDPQYRGMSSEEIYRELLKHNPVSSNEKDPDASWDVLLEPGTGSYSANQEGPENLTPLEQQRIRDGLQQEFKRELRALSGKLPGNLSGFLEQELQKAQQAKIPWQSILARFVSGLKRSDYRSFPFNKRHLWRGIGLPSIGIPGPEHLVVAVDTSGSMSSALLKQVLAEIDQIRVFSECRLTLIECDATIQKISDWEAWEDSTQAFSQWNFRGRGGTAFTPVFDWISKEIEAGSIAPDALIYCTDGYGLFPKQTSHLPLLWVVSEEDLPPEEFPYGEVLVFPED